MPHGAMPRRTPQVHPLASRVREELGKRKCLSIPAGNRARLLPLSKAVDTQPLEHWDHQHEPLPLRSFVAPLLRSLDQQLARRLVVTFLETLQALLIWRHRNLGMLLSELSSYLAPPGKAPAGTKRLSNLLRSPKWEARLIADWLWQQAVERVTSLVATGQHALLVWDDSVIEKSESERHPDYCSIRSSKAHRLTRIRKGFYRPPLTGAPISIAGLHWVGLLVCGHSGAPTVAAMQWWTKRGSHASDHKTVISTSLPPSTFSTSLPERQKTAETDMPNRYRLIRSPV